MLGIKNRMLGIKNRTLGIKNRTLANISLLVVVMDQPKSAESGTSNSTQGHSTS
ncbi:hypothetical protein BGZ49_002906 [Haplosporangium sp. Z 27]|nr:hypothetical protein BGZ49_002906 [Haplosporangium sp. Z 27]